MSGFRVAVLARAPVAGRTKTRMSPPLRPEQAAELQAACIADVLHRYADVDERTIWVTEPHEAWAQARALGWTVATQPEGSLGHRMEVALQGERLTAVLGTDSPDLPRSLLDAAVATVEGGSADVAFVGADDGGFCAVVANQLPEGGFDRIAWSQPDTLRATMARLERLGLRCACVGVWYDLDTVADLQRLALESERQPHGAPTRALAWLRALENQPEPGGRARLHALPMEQHDD